MNTDEAGEMPGTVVASVKHAVAILVALAAAWGVPAAAAGQQDEVVPRQIRIYGQAGGLQNVQVHPVPAPMVPPVPVEGEKPPAAGDSQPGEAETEKEKTEGSEKKEAEPAVITRPEKPAEPPDPQEFERAVVGPDGEIDRFVFRGQAWPDVMDWVARISQMSVDWQTLPGDYVNVATQRPLSVEAVRDLVNRHLLARGFTMLVENEFITVVECEKVSSSLVPRVRPEQLAGRWPHEFVRVSFQLDWLVAADLTEELQPMMSRNGKLYALTTTNRLEAIDAVANLTQVYGVLKEEQYRDEENQLIREFELEFARADTVKEQLEVFLDIDSKSRQSPGPMTPEMMQMQQQQQQAMMQLQMQQAQANPGGGGAAASRNKKKDRVSLMVNRSRNSLVVLAPPDTMEVIAESIKALDVAPRGSGSLDGILGRMRVYRLSQLDPGTLIAALRETGGLDPQTELYVDNANRAIIAKATVADHYTIQTTIDKLDGSARRFEVIQLRHLRADEVAGTLEYMMGSANQDDRRQRPMYFDIFGMAFGGRNRDEQGDRFRVDADVANNRLLLKANDVELAEIMNFLTKLGEIPVRGTGAGFSRVLETTTIGDEAARYLQGIQQQWRAIAPNELVIPPDVIEFDGNGPPTSQPAKAAPVEGAPAKGAAEAPAVEPGTTSAPAKVTSTSGTAAVPAVLAPWAPQQIPASPLIAPRVLPDSGQQPRAATAGDPAPIVFSRDAQGRLLITSRDVAALDLLEELMARSAPPPRDYHVFQLVNAPAGWVRLNLVDFFKDEGEDSSSDRMMEYLYGIPSQRAGIGRSRLSKRPPVKFISDLDTNTILVQGADAMQLRTIAELIQLYDVPEPVSSQSKRITKLFFIQYSKAEVVADTVKDAFRDLLSENDKALMQFNQQQQQQEQQRASLGTTYITNFGTGDDPNQPQEKTQVRFKGKLSIGVDPVSNCLLVSCEGQNLLDVIGDTIEQLDRAARPVSTLEIVGLRADLNGERLHSALTKILAQQRAGEQPGQAPPPGTPPVVPGQMMQQPAAGPANPGIIIRPY